MKCCMDCRALQHMHKSIVMTISSAGVKDKSYRAFDEVWHKFPFIIRRETVSTAVSFKVGSRCHAVPGSDTACPAL